MGHTVPLGFRLRFFSIRNQFGQFCVFLGVIGSGIALYWAKAEAQELMVFVAIFCLGFFFL
jgi:hypothetical protein